MTTATPPDLVGETHPPQISKPSSRAMAWWRSFGRAPRVMGLDVARALAVLGMVGAHVGSTADEVRLLEPETWSALVHGRSSILFAVLAGVSIALMTGRTRIPQPQQLPALRLNLIGRGAAVFLIGLVLEMLGTPVAVILTVYGLLYVAAIPFLTWRPRSLLIAAAVLALAGPVTLALVRALTLGASAPGADLVLFGTYPMTVWMAFVFAGMALGRLPLQRLRVAVTALVAGIVLSAAGYGLGALGTAIVPDPVDGGSSSIDNSVLPGEELVPADELDLSSSICEHWGDGEYYCHPADGAETEPSGGSSSEEPEVDEEASLGDAVDGGGWAGYAQAFLDQAPAESMTSALFAADPHSGGTAEIVGSGGFALAVIGLCLLLSRPLRWVLLPLAALGSMPLTAYSGHILAILVLAGPFAIPGGEHDWGWFTLVLLVAATAWAMLFGRGPLERLVARAASAMSFPRGTVRPAADVNVPAPVSQDAPRVEP